MSSSKVSFCTEYKAKFSFQLYDQNINIDKSKQNDFLRTYLQGKRAIIRMLGGQRLQIRNYSLLNLFQLLLCSLSLSVGLPSTPSA
jgi:hypothetical protein